MILTAGQINRKGGKGNKLAVEIFKKPPISRGTRKVHERSLTTNKIEGGFGNEKDYYF